MQYTVLVVEPDRLPEGHDWAIVEVGREVIAIVAKGVTPSPDLMAERWAAFRMLERRRPRSLEVLASAPAV